MGEVMYCFKKNAAIILCVFFFNFCFVLFFPNTLIVRNKCVFLFNYTGRYLQLLPKHEKAAFLSFSLCLTGANEGLLMAIAYYFLFSKCTHRTVKKKKKKKVRGSIGPSKLWQASTDICLVKHCTTLTQNTVLPRGG